MKRLCTFLFLSIHFQLLLYSQSPSDSFVKEINAPLYLSEMTELNCKKIWFDSLLDVCDSAKAVYVQHRCRIDDSSLKGRLYLMDMKDNLIAEIEVDDVNNVRGRVGEMPGDTGVSPPGRPRFNYNGPNRYYYDNGQLKRDDYFINGILVRKKCFTLEGLDTAYFPRIELPEFPGGNDSLLAFIERSIVYPKRAIARNIQGLVLLRVRINNQGEADQIAVFESPDELLSEEAIRVVESFPKFKPPYYEGVPANFSISIPVRFRLLKPINKQTLKPEEILTKKSFRNKS